MSCDWDQPVNIDVTKKVGVYEDGIPSRLRTMAMEIVMDRSFGEAREIAMRILMDAAENIEHDRRHMRNLSEENAKLKASIRKMRAEREPQEGATT